jgi:hypothetical protein
MRPAIQQSIRAFGPAGYDMAQRNAFVAVMAQKLIRRPATDDTSAGDAEIDTTRAAGPDQAAAQTPPAGTEAILEQGSHR